MPMEPSIHPFPGLRPFEADEQELFFGREGQSEDILARLRQHRLVAVVGASGSGKSSLIRAGLLPYLHGGFLADAGSHWRIAIFRPGGDPIKNLAVSLDDPAVLGRQTESADAAAQSAVLLEVSLRRSGLGLIEAVSLARLPPNEQVLIVVDQFEELFRFAGAADQAGREEDAAAFIKLLLEATQQRELPIYVVLTMRSDYIGDCSRYSGLPEAVTNALYLIPRMTRDQRRAAIAEPVRVGGGTIAPRLVVRLLNDVGDDPDQLPILQHALMRTWDYWQAHGGSERPIDIDDYLAIGAMADALSQHADEAYDGLPDDRHRAVAKRVFQALSEKGLDNREARRPTTVGKLAQLVDVPIADIIRVVEDFRAPGRSFLMPAQGPLDRLSVIDISHESLIRGWRRMRQWVEEEAESAREYRRLAETASLHAQGTAGLLRDPDLGHAIAWREQGQCNAAWAERYGDAFDLAMNFLDESLTAERQRTKSEEAARSRRVRRRLLNVAVGLIVLLSAAATTAAIMREKARENAQIDEDAVMAAALAAYTQNDISNIETFFENTSVGSYIVGYKLFKDKYPRKAIPYLRKSIDKERFVASSYFLLGYIASHDTEDRPIHNLSDKDLSKAEGFLGEAIAANPAYSPAYYFRASLYANSNRIAAALEELRKAVLQRSLLGRGVCQAVNKPENIQKDWEPLVGNATFRDIQEECKKVHGL